MNKLCVFAKLLHNNTRIVTPLFHTATDKKVVGMFPSGKVWSQNSTIPLSSRTFRCFLSCVAASLAAAGGVRAEAMLQYFNTSSAEVTRKMPELAEAGCTSLWLPPPTKGSGGLSVGYDLWDSFDLGSKDQRGSVKTRYGTEAELLNLVEVAHLFGIRVYFDRVFPR